MNLRAGLPELGLSSIPGAVGSQQLLTLSLSLYMYTDV